MNAAPVATDNRVLVTYRIVARSGRTLTRAYLGSRMALAPVDVFNANEKDAAEFESGPRAIEVRDVLAASCENRITRDVIAQATIETVHTPHADGTAVWDAALRAKKTNDLTLLLFLEGAPAYMARAAR